MWGKLWKLITSQNSIGSSLCVHWDRRMQNVLVTRNSSFRKHDYDHSTIAKKSFVQASRVVLTTYLFWLFTLFLSIILSIIQSCPPIDLGVTFPDVGFQTSVFSTNQSFYPLCMLTSHFSELRSELVSKLTFNTELAAIQTSTHVLWWHFD